VFQLKLCAELLNEMNIIEKLYAGVKYCALVWSKKNLFMLPIFSWNFV